MDNRAVIERIMKNLAFEVEAVPNNKTVYADRTTSSKNGPLNVKIKVRKKEINGPTSEPEIVLRKVCLVNSAETIMSFDMFMDSEYGKKIERKAHKGLFNKLKPGFCLGVSDDDRQPYTSDSIHTPDVPESGSASKSDGILRQPLDLSKNSYETFFSPTQRKHRTFLGKRCKPGGCLDPPFDEAKYSYTPSIQESSTHARKIIVEQGRIDTKENMNLDLKNTDKNKRKSKDLPLQIKSVDNKVKESTSVLNSYTVESPRDSIITYPTEEVDEVHKIRADIKSSEDKKSSDAKIFRPSSIEKSRQSINETSFFSPIKAVKKDPGYVQQEPLKRHSFIPKSTKKLGPISDSLNSVPLEQHNTGPSNISIQPKLDILLQKSVSNSKDIEKIDATPYIVPIHVDEEEISIDGQIDKAEIEPLIDSKYPDVKEKLSILTNYEPFIVPIKIDEEVSIENINDVDSPIIVTDEHSIQFNNSKKYSNDNKISESSQLLKPTQPPQKNYETENGNDNNDSKEIKPIFVKQRRDTNRTLTNQNQSINLIESSKPGVENILIDKTEYLVIESSNESYDITSINDQKSTTDAIVESETTIEKYKFKEPSIISMTTSTPTNVNVDYEKKIPSVNNIFTKVLTEEPTEKEALNISTKDFQSDQRSNIDNELLNVQNQNVEAKDLEPSETKLNVVDKISTTPGQSIDVNTSIKDISEPKLNIDNKIYTIQEQSTDVNTSIKEISELKLNIEDINSTTQGQSIDVNTLIKDITEPKLNLEDKNYTIQEQGSNVNITTKGLSEPKPTLNEEKSITQEPNLSLNANTDILNLLKPNLNLKDVDSNFQGQNLLVNTKVSHVPEIKLKDNLSNIEDHNSDVNLKDEDEEAKSRHSNENNFDKKPIIETNSIIEHHFEVMEILAETNNKIESSKVPTQIPNDNRKLSTENIKIPKEYTNTYIFDQKGEIIKHDSLDKVSPSKIEKESIFPINSNAIGPETNTQKSIISESNRNVVDKPKENIITDDIKSTTDPRTVILNLGFHSYINSKNERVIETVDGNSTNKYPKDSLSVVQSKIQLLTNEKCPKLNVPIDSTLDLIIKINENQHRRDAVPAKTRIKPISEFHELAKPSNSPGAKMICEQRICYEKILQNTLTDIYEQKLIPLRKVLKDLKSDIDKLTGQQTVFKKRVHGLEKIRQPRLMMSNKRCGPCRQ